jgi:NhaC family Na+:H+ antiporter
MSAGTDLYHHIYAMLFTTVPSFLLAALIFLVIGSGYTGSSEYEAQITAIQSALADSYRMGPLLTLLPLATLATLSIRRVPAETTMAASVVVATAVAWLYQGDSLPQVLNVLWQNSPPDTGIENLDDLLGRGGIASMSWTLILALMALALGGLLHGSGILRALLAGLVARVQHTVALIATTIAAGFAGNLAMGEAYISIILNCQLFREKYRSKQLDPALLSRSVEEGSTMTTGLIPWTTAGAFYAATLGVPVLDYVPYAFFNTLNGVIAILLAALGFGLLDHTATNQQTE